MKFLGLQKRTLDSTVNTSIINLWKKCKSNQYVKAILEMQLLDIEQINEKNNHLIKQEIKAYIIKYASCRTKTEILIKK